MDKYSTSHICEEEPVFSQPTAFPCFFLKKQISLLNHCARVLQNPKPGSVLQEGMEHSKEEEKRST